MSSKPNKPVSKQSEGPMEEWDDPVIDPLLNPAPIIDGLLPAIVGDNHRNIVTRAMQLNGVVLNVEPWVRGFLNPFETLTVFVNDRPIHIETYDTADLLPNPVVVSLGPKSHLQSHGLKDIRVHVLNASDNDINYNILRVYVDAQDPNYSAQPARITFEDYGVELTPDFLDGKAGLGFTIAEPADRRGGDTYGIHVGSSNNPLMDDVPLTGPIEGVIPTANILDKAGEIPVWYFLRDRAGNSTVLSIPTYVRVSLNAPPVIGAITVLEAPLVDKAEARAGATVRISSVTEHLTSDTLVVLWGTVEIYRQAIGMGVFPLDVSANFAAIAAGGNFYTADIHVRIERTGSPSYPAPVVQVDVDLREPGVTNPGEGPVDTNLERPILFGGGALPSPPNRLSEKDRGFDATATFELPPLLAAGDFIDYVYAGTVADTYPVTGAEAPGFMVTFTVPWSLIDATGNGDSIPTHCVIRDAINFKHSPNQDVMVEIFNLAGLELAIFNNAQAFAGQPNFSYFINCTRQPWLGVPIKILDPGLLMIDDKVSLEAVRYAYVPPGTPIGAPVGTPVESAEFTITSTEVNLGLVVPMDLRAWFEDFTGTQGRGYIGLRWKLFRPSTGDRGLSDEVRAVWDLQEAGTPPTCVPGATRRSGTL